MFARILITETSSSLLSKMVCESCVENAFFSKARAIVAIKSI